VKAAPFSYVAPESVEETISVLAEHGDDAKVLAGGQSLMPLMALRLAAPAVVVDVNRLPGLDRIERGPDGLRLGALVRHRDIERLADLADDCPLLADAVPLIGHVAIRNRGTVVGSLAHADPAAEWPAVALALDGRVTAVGARGTRQIDASAFFASYLTNTLEPDELATHVEVRLGNGTAGSSFVELARRYGDFGLCGVAAVLRMSPAGTVADARVVVSGCGPTPIRIAECEPLLTGQHPSADLFEAAAEVVFESVDPPGDIHGSAEYRRHVTRVVARRALERASTRAACNARAQG
jgi:carbon-monoxide dehydrogenase medium subunit